MKLKLLALVIAISLSLLALAHADFTKTVAMAGHQEDEVTTRTIAYTILNRAKALKVTPKQVCDELSVFPCYGDEVCEQAWTDRYYHASVYDKASKAIAQAKTMKPNKVTKFHHKSVFPMWAEGRKRKQVGGYYFYEGVL